VSPGTAFKLALSATALFPENATVAAAMSPPEIEKFCGAFSEDELVALPIRFPENEPLTSRFTIVDAVLDVVAASIAAVYDAPPILSTPMPSELPMNAVLDRYEYASSPACNELVAGVVVVVDLFISILVLAIVFPY